MKSLVSMATCLSAILLSLSVSAQERPVGFKSGNFFESQRILGDLRVSCVHPAGFRETRFYNCSMEILNPIEMTYFVGPVVDADEVRLTALHTDGSQKSKTNKYDGKQGVSKSRFNLWVKTLTQSPLLDLGENRISYELTKKDKLVAQGEFVAQVDRVQPAYCRAASYSDSGQCADSYTYCSRYFRDQNYCQ